MYLYFDITSAGMILDIIAKNCKKYRPIFNSGQKMALRAAYVVIC